MNETLTLSGSEQIVVVESTPDRFEVEATYAPHGARPPMHLHPNHSEQFTVLTGTLRVGLADSEHDYTAGESFDIGAGIAHHMWNAGDEPATVRWISTPAGRVESLFRCLDELHRRGKASLAAQAAVLRRHSDVMVPSSAAARMLVRVLGAVSSR
ncbi:cupin domain-containing protein [uncultured Microbacterium sp.]|uniref:cupin domain-containing protein n=1 Tax=uncultured Microbacterium sp. TaxID=191216 RepID=UPI00261F3499|nr:cupin domain-containing protein [uncultured Microbacterium sp.]